MAMGNYNVNPPGDGTKSPKPALSAFPSWPRLPSRNSTGVWGRGKFLPLRGKLVYGTFGSPGAIPKQLLNTWKTQYKHRFLNFPGAGTKSYAVGFPRIVGQPVSAKSTGIASISSIGWGWGGMGIGVLDFWFPGAPFFYWES